MPGARPFMPFFSGIFATPLPFNRLSSRQFSAPSLPTRLAPAAALAAILAFASAPATAARGPENIADVAEQVIDAVVNISTSQKVDPRVSQLPDVPPGSPMEEFFDQFFKNRRGPGGSDQAPRRVNSLGSGFIIDASGLVVTNNHVIADADEINVILNDGTRLKATLVGKDNKSDLALLRVRSENKPLKAVKFGDSEKLRLGEWVIAIGNPFSLGGSVTAGIVSARNRDINSGPYDNYIQTDAAINRGNSGGPLFNLSGEVVGVNTAIISPSGGSIGIGFAVPANSAVAVIDQLRQFGETRRGWLGVRIQQVTDDIAESLNITPPRGALVAGVDDKGPAKPAGIEPGDVVVAFDGRDIKEMHDLPALSDDQRRKFKIKSGVNGVLVTGVDPSVALADPDKRLAPGDVIVEVQYEAVGSPDDMKTRLDTLKAQGKKIAVLLVSNGAGDTRFVALNLQ